MLGGLPAIADVWFTRGDGWMTDDDAGVDAIYWRKRDGSKGAEFSERMYERLEKHDEYWQAYVTEQVSEWLAYEQDEPTNEMIPFDLPLAAPSVR